MNVSARPAAVELVAGKLYVLGANVKLDGRLSWVPESSRGYQPNNVLMLVEGRRALLVDAGLAVIQSELLAQLKAVLKPDASISIFVTRPELDCIGNIDAIADQHDVAAIQGFVDIGTIEKKSSNELPARSKFGEALTLGGDRIVSVVVPGLRFLPTYWLYDAATKTLCTSDIFNYVLNREADDPRVLTDASATPSPDEIGDIFAAKFWWARATPPGVLARDLAAVFQEYDVEIIAPSMGRVIQGRAAVRANVRAFMNSLPGGSEVSL